MKVYVLLQPKGSYEDYRVNIINIYANREDAEKAGKELDSKCVFSLQECPISNEDYERWNNTYPTSSLADEFEEKYGKGIIDTLFDYSDIYFEYCEPCEVVEYELL